MVIDGNGHTADANHLERIFVIKSRDVTLRNINFINGKTAGGGGAIGSYFDMSLYDCNFENNFCCGDDGGAIYLEHYDDHVPKVVLKK